MSSFIPSFQHTQARGNARRQLLLDAASELLEERPLREISLQTIAERAGVPTGSAYHFFPNVVAVWTSLVHRFADCFREELSELFSDPVLVQRLERWQDVLDLVVEGAASYYARNPAARQVQLGGQAPAEIKFADRLNDRALGEFLEDTLERFFYLPNLPRRSEILYLAIEIADRVLSLSVIEHGTITDEMAEEARRACTAYLRTYLPDMLPRRVESAATADDALNPSAQTGGCA